MQINSLQILLLSTLFLCSSPTTLLPTITPLPNPPRILIQMYMQSLCPYCQLFFTQQLPSLINLTNIFKLRIIPYGGTQTYKQGGDYIFTCSHGAVECEGNALIMCSQGIYGYSRNSLGFISCLEGSNKNWSLIGPSCARQFSVDWQKVKRCVRSKWLQRRMVEAGVETRRRGIEAAPTFFVDGVKNGMVQTNAVAVVCGSYRGSRLPGACRQYRRRY